jgi:CRISPR-associated protein Cmr1
MVWKNSSNAVERSVIMRNQRKQPPVPPPDVTPVQKENVITQVREYQLITPLFGGGVTPGECDPVTVIRGTEIRGQLRFWWRATRGGQFTDIKALKEEEDKIWGAPYKKGAKEVPHEETVQITVEIINSGTPVKPFDKDKQKQRGSAQEPQIPAYAAFPLQPNQDRNKQAKPPQTVQNGVSFKLTITFPASKKDDIEAALWAWETFGGIGARTRRGFGALYLLKINGQINVDLPNANKPEEWIQEKLIHFVDDGKVPIGTPHLSKRTQFRTTRASIDAISAWNQLIRKLQQFRQARYGGPYGRSMWPEADTIRHLTRTSHTGEVPHPTVNKFPRAAFGLPIIFHFKDPGDPGDTSLEGATKDFERLASPLIIRPLRCNNNRFIGLALLLEGPRTPPGGIQLMENGHPHPANATLTRAEANQIPVLNGQTDVLQAFMDTLP